VECHRVTGDENVLLEVQAADMDELTEVVDLYFALGQLFGRRAFVVLTAGSLLLIGSGARTRPR